MPITDASLNQLFQNDWKIDTDGLDERDFIVEDGIRTDILYFTAPALSLPRYKVQYYEIN